MDTPTLNVEAAAYRDVLLTLASYPLETGGVLLGPVGSTRITEFYHDVTGTRNQMSYTPDHEALNHLLKTKWCPEGLTLKGFVHSHPGTLDTLSAGDFRYVARLLATNTYLETFATPIVLPAYFRFCPLVVHRDSPNVARRAQLILFEEGI